jgi:hypothetical protein
MVVGLGQLDEGPIGREERPRDAAIERALASIKAIASEHLDCFVLIGYDAQGSEWIAARAMSPRDDRAMTQSMREWLDDGGVSAMIEAMGEDDEDGYDDLAGHEDEYFC